MNENDLKTADRDYPTASGEDIVCLTMQWETINWRKVYGHVNRMKTRIAKASLNSQTENVRRLQRLLVNSLDARLAAVKAVTTNKGRRTAGVDGVLWNTSAQKMRAALTLDPKEYKAKPLKRVYIEKKGKKGKKRPLSIPTMRDRAMQTLFAEALSPVAEAGGDRHSYGFRKGRSAQDAYAQIVVNLSHKNSAEWVLEGDIKGCFDNIDHEWLLRNIPMDKGMLRQFLKAGYMHQGLLHDAANGTPQGGIISPILANMALDGIDGLLDKKYHTNHSGGHRVNYVRYADDFIVTARTEEMAWEIKGMLAEFMSERGLELSSEKTLVTRVDEGFDFLGWTFRKFRGKLVPMPSKASVKRFLGEVKQVVKKVGPAVTQDELIAILNPKIRGFANYHKNACSSRTFGYIDNRIYRLLVGWAKRKHGKKNAKWRHKRYWRSQGGRNYIFGTEERTLLLMSWQHIVRRSPLACEKNPYIDPEYFDKRAYEHRRKARNSFRPAAP